jgi:hypothetical protein
VAHGVRRHERANRRRSPWLVPPGRLTLDGDGLDISPSGDRLLLTIAHAADIWLVELR